MALSCQVNKFLSTCRFDANHVIDLRFNAENAFLGTAIDEVPGPPENGADTRTIVYQTFLAAPYIASTEGFNETKWSGTNRAGDNKDSIGIIIDAFAHHSLIESQFTAVLADLQGGLVHVFIRWHYSKWPSRNAQQIYQRDRIIRPPNAHVSLRLHKAACIKTDVIVSTWPGERMYVDDRQAGIDEFIQGHQCNKVCRAMGLHKEKRGRPWEK